MKRTCIQAVDHRDPAIAASIHRVQVAAYVQLASEVLGLHQPSQFPALQRTVEDICSSDEQFTAAFDEAARGSDAMIGAISVEPPEIASWSGESLQSMNIPGARPGVTAGPYHIASLTVLPTHHRNGVGRALLNVVIESCDPAPLTVSTDVRNAPALKLFRDCGFREHRRRRITFAGHQYDLVLLLRNPVWQAAV